MSSPIRVDFLRPEDHGLAGRLGLTIAPGKQDAARGWNRSLVADLARLRTTYGTDLLVSLMEAHEYRMLEITDLDERAAVAGIAVVRLPIRDVDAPTARDMPRFLALVRALIDPLRAGRTVVIHCRGGLGRSGLVAASCLVVLGADAATAIDKVRAARPGAVEVPVQERWVAAVARTVSQIVGTP